MSQTRRAQDKREAFYLQDKEGRRESDYKKEIEYLINDALSQVYTGSYAAAVWRLVDAAGLCVSRTDEKGRKDLIGFEEPTMRGFKLNTMYQARRERQV